MDIQRKAFEESNNVNPDWSFKFDEELQQYIAVDFEMTSQVDEFNEHWDTFRAGWDAKAQAVPAEKNWDEIHLNPKERLYWSLRSAKKRKSDLNWYHASHQTCVGSTHGRKICEYLGVDPDGKDFVRKQEPTND